jgi:hypothetical protein
MPTPKLTQQVFEMRYDRGYRYLDRCGEALLILEDVLPTETQLSWMPDELAPSGARLKCPELDIQISFDSYRLQIDQTVADKPKEFPHICEILAATISARFDLRSIVRLGFRRFYMVPTDSVLQAEEMSVKMSPFKDWPMPPPEGFVSAAVEAASVFERDDHSEGIRFAVRPSARIEAPLQIDQRLQVPAHLRNEKQNLVLLDQLKRQAQRERSPLAGLLLDVDSYQNRPPKPDVGKFLSDAVQQADNLTLVYMAQRFK